MTRPGADDPGSWAGKRFKSIHGVPKQIFDELVEEARQHKELRGKECHGDGVRGRFSKPLELKVAATLEMCQAGLLFKSVERLYKISIPVMQKFFHSFMQLQVEHEYHKHVYYPKSDAAITQVLTKHDLFGFPGTITLFDGVKVRWGGCSFADRFANVGKEGYPTRVFMVAGDCTKVVHHVHGSHPGGRNDLTLSHYDEYLQAMRRGLYKDHTFQVYSGNGDEKVTVSNLHAFTDNGFHQWLETQFPSKVSREVWLRRWSKRGESFRKPGTECIYGILKKRFRILKQEIPFTDAASIDNVFRFLVSLHNRMQRFYGLDTLGEHVEDWQMANIDMDTVRLQGTPQSCPHVVDNEALGNVTTPDVEFGWFGIRKALVTHFQKAWEKNEILWLKPASECRPGYQDRQALCANRYRRGEAGGEHVDSDDDD